VSRYFLAFLGLTLLVFTAGCGDDDDDSSSPEQMTTLALSFQGLEALANGYHYEGWAIIGGSPVSTGKFNIGATGAIVDVNGNPIASGEFDTGQDLSTASAIVLTIEPDGDTDTNPADTHVMAGGVANLSASLSIGDAAALGDDFSSASGTYILATPTDGADTNENSGIWFLDLSTGSPAEGLVLPDLPVGWAYEGWVVIEGTPVTTGKFTDVAAEDESDPYSSTMPGPPFPGEDFLVNAPAGLTFPTDIAGGTAVISVEPDPDDDVAPYTLKPLVGSIPTDATDHVNYDMSNNSAAYPTGNATIK
jgi:hypothetical protein